LWLDTLVDACVEIYTQDLFTFETVPYEMFGVGIGAVEQVV
jgi:hypothetical protein